MLRGISNKISFHIHKLFVFLYVNYKFIIRDSWKSIDGICLPLYSEIGFNTLRWIIDGEYEIGEINIIKNTIERDDIILEIGTGLGFVSSYCAKITSSSQVFTFEANPLNYELAKSVFFKNNVSPSIKNAYLTNEEGFVDFPINQKSRLASSIKDNTNAFYTIQKLNLNKVIAEIKPTYLIMDIEGAEFDVFSIINFQTIKKIQFELHPSILDKSKCDFIFNLLSENSFQLDTTNSLHPNYYFLKK